MRSTIPARPSDNIFAESQSGPRSSRRHLAMMSFFTFTEFDWLTIKIYVRNMVRVVHAFKPARPPQATTDQDLDALPESFRFPHNLYQERERNRGHIKFGKKKIVEISSGIISSSAFILLIGSTTQLICISAMSAFYRTQVNLGSDLWVRMSVRPRPL